MGIQTEAHITGVAIRLAIAESPFTVSTIQDNMDKNAKENLIREVLQQLEVDNWVDETSGPIPSWKAGPLARKYGNMVKYRREFEGEIPVLPDER